MKGQSRTGGLDKDNLVDVYTSLDGFRILYKFILSIQNSYLKGDDGTLLSRASEMKETAAFSPCHITGFFQIFDQRSDPLHVGSRGAGVSLSHGVRTEVKVRKATKNSAQIIINGSVSDSAEVSNHVLKAFLGRLEKKEDFNVIVEHHVMLPIGAGFGTSGAAALGLALALNEAFNLKLSKTEAAQLAHTVEVACRTGLGTVIAETFGGLEVRVSPGAPGIGEIRHVPLSQDYMVVCLNFNSLPTQKFLTDEKTRARINELGGKLVDDFIRSPNPNNFMKYSRQFAEQVGLITEKVRMVLDATDNAEFVCSMPMFGESAFVLIERESLPKILEIFQRHSGEGRIVVSKIDFEGARLLE